MRKIFVILFMMCISYAAFSQKEDWGKLARYAKQNDSVKNVSVVFMGNSIFDRWINNDQDYFAKNNYVNRGIGGNNTSQMLLRFRQDVINLKPKAVVILGGVNDLAQGTWSYQIIMNNIQSMTDLAKANRIKVVLCSVMPVYEIKYAKYLHLTDSIIALNKMIRDYSTRAAVSYIDLHTALKDEKNGLPDALTNDGIHPNKEGYKRMEAIIEPVIRKILKKK